MNFNKKINLKKYKDTKFDIIVCFGQSNAQGQGLGNEELAYPKDERILELRSEKYIGYYYRGVDKVGDPLKDKDGNILFDFINPKNNSAVFTYSNRTLDLNIEPERFVSTFAQAYKKYCLDFNRSILVVFLGSGGTGYEDKAWSKNGACRNALYNLIDLALSLNKDNRIVAALYHQGERDADCGIYPSLKERYNFFYHNFVSYMNEMKRKYKQFTFPIISGEFCKEWATLKEKNKSTNLIIKALYDAKKDISNYDVVKTDGVKSNNQVLHNGDNIHFSRIGSIELGKRYFDKYLELISINQTSKKFNYLPEVASVANQMKDYHLWDASVIKVKNKYYMFNSRWPKKYGWGWNWLFNSEIILSVSDKKEGPFKFLKVILKRRGKQYFDGMSTHNPTIKYYKGKFYLYYMGTTYSCPTYQDENKMKDKDVIEAWNNKRIGLAIANKIDGDYIRSSKPLFEPRKIPNWDSSITTNPSITILDNGETYMVYKSKYGGLEFNKPLQLGIAKAKCPSGPFKRITNKPLFNESYSIEDPFLYFDKNDYKFKMIAKDCIGNISGGYFNLFYLEGKDPSKLTIENSPTVLRRLLYWKNGKVTRQPNLERPFILFDERNKPICMYCATLDGLDTFRPINSTSYVACIRLKKK